MPDNNGYVKMNCFFASGNFSLPVSFYSLKIAVSIYVFLIIRNEEVWGVYKFFGINGKKLVQNFWAKNFSYVGII